jgi:exosome complex component RRP41
MQHILISAFSEVVHTNLYPHSTILVSLHVLSSDGGILAALINAATLALIDAGIPMSDSLVACTAGSTINHATSKSQPRGRIPGLSSLTDDVDDPLLDLSGLEEQDLPFLTVATVGGQEESKVVVCLTETRMMAQRLEEMLAVGIDGCKIVRTVLDNTVKRHGRQMLQDT